MKEFHSMMRKATFMMWTASGTVMLGSSCAADIRDSIMSAGLDFVADSAKTVLDTLVPVEDMLNGQNGA